MRLSTKSLYGVRALFDIAYHNGGQSTQVKDIAARQQLSQRYLEQIFQKLRRAGILGSRRGPKGGYFLTKDPAKITLGDVIRATEGPIELVFCTNPRNKPHQFQDTCPSAPLWTSISHKIEGLFDEITMADVCEQGRQLGIEPAQDRYMYFI